MWLMPITVQTADRCALVSNREAATHFNEEWTHAVDMCQNREEEPSANMRLAVPRVAVTSPAYQQSMISSLWPYNYSTEMRSHAVPTLLSTRRCRVHSGPRHSPDLIASTQGSQQPDSTHCDSTAPVCAFISLHSRLHSLPLNTACVVYCSVSRIYAP
jgi:hypothetical protein